MSTEQQQLDKLVDSKKKFLERLMEETESALAEGRIHEGKYLESMNSLKVLYEFYIGPAYVPIARKIIHTEH